MKIFYSAYTLKNNTGDLLINKLQIEEYARYGEVYVDCYGMPEYFQKIIFQSKNQNIKNFESIYNTHYRSWKMFKIIRKLRHDGFTHFTKSPGPFPFLRFPLKTFLIRLIGCCGYLYAKKLGMKVFIVGVDIDYPQKQYSPLTKLNKWYFRIFSFIKIRSQYNCTLVSKDLQNISYIPDMAFLYTQNSKKEETKCIAISFRKINNIDVLLHELSKIASIFVAKGYAIEILFQVEEDESFCRMIAQYLDQYNVLFHSTCISFEKLSTYKKYDFVISNRLHVLLMAAAHGAIPYALISNSKKERKIQNIFECCFEEALLGHISNFKIEAIEYLLKEKGMLTELVSSNFRKNKELCKQQIFEQFLDKI